MEVISIEILAETKYQDLYRVTDGVLLVVNKFVYIDYGYIGYFTVDGVKMSKYNKNCQEWLKVLQTDYCDKYTGIKVPKGTVTYMRRPVVPTDDELEFQYEIKTTGSMFSGDFTQMENMLSDILYRMRQGKVRGSNGSFIKVGV